MIPLALVTSAVALAAEVLKAFNNLEPEQRREIVQRLLNDDEARRTWWTNVQNWFTNTIWNRIQLPK